MYGIALRAGGFDVIEAADGCAALTRAFADGPSVVLTETALPLIDGYALCEILRQDPATHAIPVLAITSETRPSFLTRVRASGAHAVLVKPAAPDAVLDEVRRLIAGAATAEHAASAPAPGDGGDARTEAHHPKSHGSFRATQRLADPPVLHCPSCGDPLRYTHTQIGGVSERHAEQWDYYTCRSCGTFQYRRRTRKLRAVDL